MNGSICRNPYGKSHAKGFEVFYQQIPRARRCFVIFILQFQKSVAYLPRRLFKRKKAHRISERLSVFKLWGYLFFNLNSSFEEPIDIVTSATLPEILFTV